MRYPEFLKEKGRIGYIAPSFGCADEHYGKCFAQALKGFEELGYENILGPNCYEMSGIGKSNTPEKCADEINDFFINDRSDVIISCGGGETMCEDLTFVDFERIAMSEPKWFMGFSDNTNLTYTLPVLCDTAAIYGPCASQFGKKPWHAFMKDAYDLLTGRKLSVNSYPTWEKAPKEYPEGEEPDPCEPINDTEPSCIKLFKDGVLSGNSGNAQFSGRLIGGCLDILQILCGTKYDGTAAFARKYANDGIVWFIESCDLNPMSIRRALWQLDEAGWFANVKGFIIGRPLHFDEDLMGMNHLNAVTGILDKYDVPIVLDADLGHLPPMMPLVSGAMADVSLDGQNLNIKMRLE
ncbi:MAG: LD-carboxypeptidase [Lachnospiraceae bacterium]|nr:LD-carboxypeptidase [Lachnospiraceae bacterium]